eukprot:CAMPEP_0181355320 /NCGR_PEP_ID=MMETSP1106-20121128/3835_1 /TAXON_ID=81844 /ORGANISM="Mantoniella antarctica, Strain SL-175" /LENGTH=54 /DNA_ID=CAMNT_0023468049 /DNA_START=152 /DNA_END=316 /DNA_ORIENTATION=-
MDARRDHCLSWSSSGAGGLARVGVGSGTVSNLELMAARYGLACQHAYLQKANHG